ncbi:MAG: ISL3 family transposase [Rhodothermaceae bacterium]|nr:ISL3 family transposase [Rhodothermaceae bacterium]
MSVEFKEVDAVYGITFPWQISSITTDKESKEVSLYVRCTDESTLQCPKCARVYPVYDRRPRKWRHLDTGKYRTYVEAQIPRVKCPVHGVRTITVPWASRSARMPFSFEAMAIDWLQEASISAVARLLDLSWNAIDGIMRRAVERGLARRSEQSFTRIGVDETSYKKGHKYITVVSDSDTGTVLYAGQGRTKASLKQWYDQFSPEQLERIESVSMDMWPAYINQTKASVPGAEEKISFDRFHVAKKIGEAVDQVRRKEHKDLMKQGNEDLKGTKYDWLTNKENMSTRQKKQFQQLKNSSLKTARAWAIKELSQRLWHYVSRTWALKGWKRWLSWAMRCRLEPMKKVAQTIKEHLWGIINAIVLRASNGGAESINTRIKTVKIRACGFRNVERMTTAIYFYLGGLDLYPECVRN